RDLAAALLAATGPACAGRTYYACHPEIATGLETVTMVHAAVRQAAQRPVTGPPTLVPVPVPLTGLLLWASGAVAALLGRTTPLTPGKLPEFRAEAWACSPDALERDTGWRATIPLRQGVLDTARWYTERGWL
ncbi:MAG: hypothetical protein HY337_02845, partial [Gemmatimonadetes bacterium]|nr:hypothetical protein [Gemmatimonadota bacterium]